MADDPYADAPRLPETDSIDPRSLLGSDHSPVELEIGPGRGWFLVERLEANPKLRMLGLEIRRKWATIVDRRLASRGLGHRGRVFAEDARHVLPKMKASSLSTVFIHFPDPWWKKRHQKRKVIGQDLLDDLGRLLVPDGELFVQTDVEERADEFEALIGAHHDFVPFGDIARIGTNPYGTPSPRERRAVADGLPIARLRYRRRRL